MFSCPSLFVYFETTSYFQASIVAAITYLVKLGPEETQSASLRRCDVAVDLERSGDTRRRGKVSDEVWVCEYGRYFYASRGVLHLTPIEAEADVFR